MIAVSFRSSEKSNICAIKVKLLADLLKRENSTVIVACKSLNYFLELLVRDLRRYTWRFCLSIRFIDKVSG